MDQREKRGGDLFSQGKFWREAGERSRRFRRKPDGRRLGTASDSFDFGQVEAFTEFLEEDIWYRDRRVTISDS